MYIQDLKSGEKIEVIIEPVSKKDFAKIKNNPSFNFDWAPYKNGEVYKLRIANEEKIRGLMCIIDHIDGNDAIEIELLEVEDENVGKKKQLDRIAGILIAFACRESIKRGHEGYFFLYAKSNLVIHYHNKYHLQYMGRIGNKGELMTGEEGVSRQLIKEYLG